MAPRLLACHLAWGMGRAHNVRMGETLLDVKGLSCPLPVLRANKVLRGLPAGEKLRVLATDRAAVADFRAYCKETGHDLLSFAEEAGVFSFTIRRRAEATP
jgi:tRNA 2-thiouridine synthesizing protein A